MTNSGHLFFYNIISNKYYFYSMWPLIATMFSLFVVSCPEQCGSDTWAFVNVLIGIDSLRVINTLFRGTDTPIPDVKPKKWWLFHVKTKV